MKEFSFQKFNENDFDWEDAALYKTFRDFVNDDRKRISRFMKKSEEQKEKFQICSFCKRRYLRMRVHDKLFLGCNSSKKNGDND